MDTLKYPIDVLRLVDKSNCRKCGSPTCLAFAAAVINGQKKLSDCPNLSQEVLARYEGGVAAKESPAQRGMEAVEELKKQIAEIDLKAAAERIGAPFANGRLTVQCLGKNFSVDTNGNIITDIHVNPWIGVPVLTYILHSAGEPPTGEWVHYRDLPNGKIREPLFEQCCEKICKRIADINPDFFHDLIHLFNGRPVTNHYESDVSLVIHPLPTLPMLICYWKPDGAMPSELNIFFDANAENNLHVDSIFSLATGLVTMFETISHRHGHELG